jgi:hypothetical protein
LPPWSSWSSPSSSSSSMIITATIITKGTASSSEAHWSREHLVTLPSARTLSVSKPTMIIRLLYWLFVYVMFLWKSSDIFRNKLSLQCRDHASLPSFHRSLRGIDRCLILWRNSSMRARAAAFLRFLDHSQWHTTVGWTFLDEGSAVAETSTRQHTAITRDRHPCPQRDSNFQSQQAIFRRPSPYTSWPLRSAELMLHVTVIITA